MICDIHMCLHFTFRVSFLSIFGPGWADNDNEDTSSLHVVVSRFTLGDNRRFTGAIFRLYILIYPSCQKYP